MDLKLTKEQEEYVEAKIDESVAAQIHKVTQKVKRSMALVLRFNEMMEEHLKGNKAVVFRQDAKGKVEAMVFEREFFWGNLLKKEPAPLRAHKGKTIQEAILNMPEATDETYADDLTRQMMSNVEFGDNVEPLPVGRWQWFKWWVIVLWAKVTKNEEVFNKKIMSRDLHYMFGRGR